MDDGKNHKKRVSQREEQLDGDEYAAVEIVYELYGKVIRIFFRSKFRENPELADELIQETLFRICMKAHQIPPSGEARYWVIAFAKNVLLEQLRLQIKGRPVDLESLDDGADTHLQSDVTADSQLLEKENDELVSRYLDILTPHEKLVFMHTYEDRMTPMEISLRYDLSVQTVRNQLMRGRSKLKKALIDYNTQRR